MDNGNFAAYTQHKTKNTLGILCRSKQIKYYLHERGKTMKIIYGILLGLMMLANTAFAAETGYGAKGALNTPQPTVQEMLNFAIQDEHLARNQYMTVIDTFGKVRPFSNIVLSEERHIAYLEPLFTDRGWDIPADKSISYVVKPKTFAEALNLGVAAEIDNIAMYEYFLQQPKLPDDLKTVFELLHSASEKHLEAFSKKRNKI